MNVIANLPPRQIMLSICQSHRVKLDDVLAKRIKTRPNPAIDLPRAEIIATLRDHKEYSWGQIANLMNRGRKTIRVIYDRQKAREAKQARATVGRDVTQFDPEELDAQIRRLSGVELSYQIADDLKLQQAQAIFLAVLAQAYPRVLTLDQFCELYDAASERIYVGRESMITLEAVKTQTSNIKRHFDKMGLNHPVKRILPGGIKLDEDSAVWFHNRYGYPINCRKSFMAA